MKLNDYVVKSSLEEVSHSSGYAKAQSGGRIGAASSQSFAQRQAIDYRNSKVRSYRDSQLGQLRMAQKTKMESSRSALDQIRAKREERASNYFRQNLNRQKNTLSNGQIDQSTKIRMIKSGFGEVQQTGMVGFYGSQTPSSQNVVRSFRPQIKPKF